MKLYSVCHQRYTVVKQHNALFLLLCQRPAEQPRSPHSQIYVTHGPITKLTPVHDDMEILLTCLRSYLMTLWIAKFTGRLWWINEYRALVKWHWLRETKTLRKKPVPVQLGPRQIQHELVRDRTRFSAMRAGPRWLNRGTALLTDQSLLFTNKIR